MLPNCGDRSIQKALGTVSSETAASLAKVPHNLSGEQIAKSSHGVTHVLNAFSKYGYRFDPETKTKDIRLLN